jgi:hypothetical protein
MSVELSVTSPARSSLYGTAGTFNLNVDTVKKRPADLAQVSLDNRRSATAFARGIAVEAAGAPVRFSTAHWSVFTGCQAGKLPDLGRKK